MTALDHRAECALAALLTEEQFARQVIDLAALTNWKVYRAEQSTRLVRRRDGSYVRARNVNVQGVGFPDLLLCRAGQIIVAELKRGKRKGGGTYGVTPEQQSWLDALDAVPGVRAFVWTPADMGTITSILTHTKEGETK